MPHGIDLPATPKSKYSCYLLYEQPSLARIHSFTHIHFYCCKRLLGRNNTATTSAPHGRCQHLFKGGCSTTLLQRNGLTPHLALLLITNGGPFLTSLTRQLPGKHSSYLHPYNHRTCSFHATSRDSPFSAPLLGTFAPLIIHIVDFYLQKWQTL